MSKYASILFSPEKFHEIGPFRFPIYNDLTPGESKGIEAISRKQSKQTFKSIRLAQQIAKDKKILSEMEAEILRLLSESEGNILDDQVLIDTLAQSKKTSVEVNERVSAAEVLGKEINIACNRYVPVATRGSIMYFVIADLANIDPMYQFSLAYFLGLFKRSIDAAQTADDLTERLMILVNDICYNAFVNVCRGLFERHKLIFGFMITAQILLRADLLNQMEFGLLLRGIGVLDISEIPENPSPDGIPEKQWQFVYGIEQMTERCKGLCAHIAEHTEEWENWWSLEHPEEGGAVREGILAHIGRCGRSLSRREGHLWQRDAEPLHLRRG